MLIRGFVRRPKLLIAIAAALAVLLLAPQSLPFSVQLATAWVTGGLIYLAFAFHTMTNCDAAMIRRRAAIEDETRLVFLGLILLAAVSSFFAVIVLIGDAKVMKGMTKASAVGLAGLVILVSWLIMQIVFTMHYAHDYYQQAPGADGIAGGLLFPGEPNPDYWDFFYFTTSIGATSQTSDVAITSKPLRRLATFQAIVAFVFNTTVVALAINLASSFL